MAYACIQCPRTFQHAKNLINHLEIEKQSLDEDDKPLIEGQIDRKIEEIKKILYTCPNCHIFIEKKCNLDRHKESCKKKAFDDTDKVIPEITPSIPVTPIISSRTIIIPNSKYPPLSRNPISNPISKYPSLSKNPIKKKPLPPPPITYEPEPEDETEPVLEPEPEPEAEPAPEPEAKADPEPEKQMVVFASNLVDPEIIARHGRDPKFKVMYAPYGKSAPAVEAYPLFCQKEIDGVHILVQKDNLLEFLNWKCGGPPEAYRFIQGTLYRGPEGDADFFEKVYMEGKSPDKYPMKILNEKENRFSYINDKGQEIHRGAYRHIMGALRGNILDCYLVAQNACIMAIVNKTKSIYNHDYGEWQTRICHYTKETRKQQMLKAIVARIKLRTKEYHGNV